ncbi:hypothetical protein HUW62_27855 [Myxococcus sp. AM011]|nr:hypothetical protein [Myxococcus sp. AM011]
MDVYWIGEASPTLRAPSAWRSLLFIPQFAFARAASVPADCFIIDLQDAVPLAAKAAARAGLMEALKSGVFSGRPVVPERGNGHRGWTAHRPASPEGGAPVARARDASVHGCEPGRRRPSRLARARQLHPRGRPAPQSLRNDGDVGDARPLGPVLLLTRPHRDEFPLRGPARTHLCQYDARAVHDGPLPRRPHVGHPRRHLPSRVPQRAPARAAARG